MQSKLFIAYLPQIIAFQTTPAKCSQLSKPSPPNVHSLLTIPSKCSYPTLYLTYHPIFKAFRTLPSNSSYISLFLNNFGLVKISLALTGGNFNKSPTNISALPPKSSLDSNISINLARRLCKKSNETIDISSTMVTSTSSRSFFQFSKFFF